MSYKKYITAEEKGSEVVGYTLKDIKTNSIIRDWSGDKLADYSIVTQRISNLTGQILTIVDAAIPEGKQNKCVKDLIRKVFTDELFEMCDYMVDGKKIQDIVEKAEEELDDEDFVPVSHEEILGA